jgi:hypothetical protein
VIAVKEGFLNAFAGGVGVKITVSSTPSAGVSFTFPSTAASYDSTGTGAGNPINPNWVRGGATSTTALTTSAVIDSTSTTASSLSVYYYINTETNAGPTTIEFLEIPVTVAVANNFTAPIPSTTFTYTVQLAPVQNAFTSSGGLTNLLAPRFADVIAGSGTLATVSGSSTTLMVPYASWQGIVGGYDTGLAVSNTTEDPGSTILGFTGAVANGGSMTFYFFPQDTTQPAFKYATSSLTATTGGLDASGNLLSGGTFVALLSQMFTKSTAVTGTATPGSSFTGYIIIQCNFTNAHGIFTVSNFVNITAQSGMMMVLSGTRAAPEKLQF